MELKDMRDEIIRIDASIVEQFGRRMNLSREVGRYKAENSVPVLDERREAEVLERVAETLADKSMLPYAMELYALLLRQSREEQEEIIAGLSATGGAAAYQGIPGAFGEAAAIAYFGAERELLPCPRFKDVFEAVAEGRTEFGILPAENSTTGSIREVYDLLEASGLYIAGEIGVKIDYCLIGTSDASVGGIRAVYSHEQGFLQCAKYLEGRGWEHVPSHNNAAAAAYVSERGRRELAALAGRHAAERYNLKIMAENIQDSGRNETRFIVVSRRLEKEGGKYTICAELQHEPGSLERLLTNFAACGLNLTRIESRPIRRENWRYRFFIDCVRVFESDPTDILLDILGKTGVRARLLGRYRDVGSK